MTPVTHESRAAHPASIIALLAGIWLLLSPWVYAVPTSPDAWNSWIVGALILIFAAIRLNRPGVAGPSCLNMVLGIWTFVSPWLYGYTGDTGRFINSLCVGVIVFIAALISASAVPECWTMPGHRRV